MAIRLTRKNSCSLLFVVHRRTPSTVFLLLAAQGLTFHDLAKRTGLHFRTCHNVANGSSDSKRARRKIEAALGVRIWSDDLPGGSETGAAAETAE